MQSKSVRENSLNFKQRLALVDWLRANENKMPDMLIEDIVTAAGKHIGATCSLKQLRSICAAAHIKWQPKRKEREVAARPVTLRDEVLALNREVARLQLRFLALCQELGVEVAKLDGPDNLDELIADITDD